MSLRRPVIVALLALTACSPASNNGQQGAAQSGKWPPADYGKFAARPPMSVGAELQDPWTLAIDAERWSYRIGRATEGLGEQPAAELPPARPDDLLVRAYVGQRNAAIRLQRLVQIACDRGVATPADCMSFRAEPWMLAATGPSAIPSNDDLMQRNIWFNDHAEAFILPACAVATKRLNDPNYCTAE